MGCQGFQEKSARWGFPDFGSYYIFINKYFEIRQGQSSIYPPHFPSPPVRIYGRPWIFTCRRNSTLSAVALQQKAAADPIQQLFCRKSRDRLG